MFFGKFCTGFHSILTCLTENIFVQAWVMMSLQLYTTLSFDIITSNTNKTWQDITVYTNKVLLPLYHNRRWLSWVGMFSSAIQIQFSMTYAIKYYLYEHYHFDNKIMKETFCVISLNTSSCVKMYFLPRINQIWKTNTDDLNESVT